MEEEHRIERRCDRVQANFTHIGPCQYHDADHRAGRCADHLPPSWFGWLDTVWVMTVPGMLGSAFGTFLLRQFMLTIPRELDEAALIEGASLFRIYWQIILPLVRSPLVVLTVLTIMTVWNDFAWPLVMLNSTNVMTLTLGLAVFATGGTQEYVDVPLTMAAATMTVAPLILIFLVAQRYFIRGIALTGFGGR